MSTYPATFPISQNDTSPAIETQLEYWDATNNEWKAKDISGFNEVKFFMRVPGSGTTKVSETESGGNVTVTDAANGKVKYAWSPEDTDTAGTFEAEWEVEYSDGTVETWPNGNRFIAVKIGPDIG